MTEQTRAHLKKEFQDGARPSGADFADLFDSFVAKMDDGVRVDGNTGTLVLDRGARLGDSSDDTPGTLRFHGDSLQIHTGAGFTDVGGGGAFQVLAGDHVAYTGGNNVGIGTGFDTNKPTYPFEVEFDGSAANDKRNQVRFGPAVVCRGTGVQSFSAHFAHSEMANNEDFALRQQLDGAVNLNAPSGARMSFSQGGKTANAPMTITPAGQVLIGTTSPLKDDPVIRLQVDGGVIKSGSENFWNTTSDARVKEDIADYATGLEAIRRIRPVSFAFNGKAGTRRGERGIGIIAQEIEALMPETVSRVRASGAQGDDLDDLRIYNGSALVYALINSVRELAERVDRLEAQIAGEQG